MDTARCKAFVAAVNNGTFSKAAEELHYTTSGVSQLVSALEKDLQLRLLNRNKKGVSLTADGERLYDDIVLFLRQEEQIYQQAASIKGLLKGEIRIAAYPSICSTWLPDIISEFCDTYPNVKFYIDDSIRKNVIENLNNGKADIGFLSYKDDISDKWIELNKTQIVALVGEDSEYADKDRFSIDDCTRAKMIQASNGRDPDIERIFEKAGISPNISYVTRNSLTAASFAEHNMGVFITNELSTNMWSYKLKKLPLFPPQYVSLGMVVTKQAIASPAVKTFIEMVRRYFKA